jgi:hypothetical protein
VRAATSVGRIAYLNVRSKYAPASPAPCSIELSSTSIILHLAGQVWLLGDIDQARHVIQVSVLSPGGKERPNCLFTRRKTPTSGNFSLDWRSS